jgi:DNA-directed RNA polymerase subunit RPC12/RpoP
MKCESCGKEESILIRRVFNEGWYEYTCGECNNRFEDALEQYEIDKREAIQAQNEY